MTNKNRQAAPFDELVSQNMDVDAQQPQAASSDDCGQYIDDAMIQLQREAAHNIQLRMRQMSESDWHINPEDVVVEVQIHGTISEAVEAERMVNKRLWRNVSSETETTKVAMWQPPYELGMRDGDEVKVQDDNDGRRRSTRAKQQSGEEDGAQMIGAMISVVTRATDAMRVGTRSVEAAIGAAIEAGGEGGDGSQRRHDDDCRVQQRGTRSSSSTSSVSSVQDGGRDGDKGGDGDEEGGEQAQQQHERWATSSDVVAMDQESQSE